MFPFCPIFKRFISCQRIRIFPNITLFTEIKMGQPLSPVQLSLPRNVLIKAMGLEALKGFRIYKEPDMHALPHGVTVTSELLVYMDTDDHIVFRTSITNRDNRHEGDGILCNAGSVNIVFSCTNFERYQIADFDGVKMETSIESSTLVSSEIDQISNINTKPQESKSDVIKAEHDSDLLCLFEQQDSGQLKILNNACTLVDKIKTSSCKRDKPKCASHSYDCCDIHEKITLNQNKLLSKNKLTEERSERGMPRKKLPQKEIDTEEIKTKQEKVRATEDMGKKLRKRKVDLVYKEQGEDICENNLESDKYPQNKKTKRQCKPKEQWKKMGRPTLKVIPDFKKQIATKCRFCLQEFLDLTQLRLHISVDHRDEEGHMGYVEELGGYIYAEADKCKFCHENFTSKYLLRKHVRIEHSDHKDFAEYIQTIGGDPRKFSSSLKAACDLCHVKAPSLDDILNHARGKHAHTEDGMLYINNLKKQLQKICKECDKSFPNQKKYLQHMSTVHPPNPTTIVCAKCDKTFKNKYILMSHIKTVHQQNEERAMCHLCPKTFSTIYNLGAHLNQFHKFQPSHQCPICHETLCNKTGLKRHIRSIHEKIRDSICQFCGKAFYSKRDVDQHVTLVHVIDSEEKKPYECEYCQKRFASWRNHYKHIRLVHLKVFSFNCYFCQQGFAQGKPFREHVAKLHPEFTDYVQDKKVRCIKPADDDEEDQAVSQEETKRSLSEVAHQSRMLKCPYCSVKVKETKDIELHVKTQHPEYANDSARPLFADLAFKP